MTAFTQSATHEPPQELHSDLHTLLLTADGFATEMRSDSGAAAGGSKKSLTTLEAEPRRGSSIRGMQTICATFQQQVRSLMAELRRSTPHYVRCVKPNGEQSAAKL